MCLSNINLGGLPTTGFVVLSGLFFIEIQSKSLYTCCCFGNYFLFVCFIFDMKNKP